MHDAAPPNCTSAAGLRVILALDASAGAGRMPDDVLPLTLPGPNRRQTSALNARRGAREVLVATGQNVPGAFSPVPTSPLQVSTRAAGSTTRRFEMRGAAPV